MCDLTQRPLDARAWATVRTLPSSAAWATAADGGTMRDVVRQHRRVVESITAEFGPALPGEFDPVNLSAIANLYGLAADPSPSLQ